MTGSQSWHCWIGAGLVRGLFVPMPEWQAVLARVWVRSRGGIGVLWPTPQAPLTGSRPALYGNSLRHGDEKTRRGSQGSPGPGIPGRKNVWEGDLRKRVSRSDLRFRKTTRYAHRSLFKQLGDGIDRPHPRRGSIAKFTRTESWTE
jgi:hypothetical protein